MGNTVFFKYNYLTMPTVTTADALLNAAKDLTKALDGKIPQSTASRETIDRSVELFNTLTGNSVDILHLKKAISGA